MLDFDAADDNYTSVGDCGRFLKAIYKNELTGSENIFACLKQQERTEKIPAGAETANKTEELTDPAAGRSLITSLPAMVYEYMENEN